MKEEKMTEVREVNQRPRTYLLNAFSLNMLAPRFDGQTMVVKVRAISVEEAKEILRRGFVSAVGHENTARILSEMLGLEVQANRMTVKLRPYDDAVVAQYTGPRLPEGATKLPEGARIKFFLVMV